MSAASASPAASAASEANPSTIAHQKTDPSEVGWQFVPQYYTFVSKQPNRLHAFYSKNSFFSHGAEGEDGSPCHGQQEIHQKIVSIGFENCKVFIHSVDAQASADNGIIIQVIGEMSNRGEPWRKFVQTFFLAEQPGGYYVLNDIFRFLKDESIEDDEAIVTEEPLPELESAAPTTVEPEPPVVNVPAPPATEPALAPEPVREPTPEPEPAPTPVVEELPKPQPNGLHHEPEKEPEPVVEPPPVQELVREPTPPPAPVQKSPVPAHLAQSSPASVAQLQEQQHAPPQPAQPAHPPTPKTWANLAAADSKKWGAAVAQESRGVTVEAAPAARPPSRSGSNTPVSSSGAAGPGPRPGSGQKNARMNHQQYQQYQQAMNVASPQVFVKGLIDPIKNEELESILGQYGKLKNIDFARHSACAFAEYEDVKSAQRAILASLNQNAGGDGGIYYTKDKNSSPLRIIVETKKERGERPPPRGRGGIPQQGNRGGGNFRGGRGGGGSARGRGGAPNPGAAKNV